MVKKKKKKERMNALQSNPPTVIKPNLWEAKELNLHTQKAALNHKAIHPSIDLFEKQLKKALREK